MSKTGLEEGVWTVARLVIRLEEQHILVQHLSTGHVVALFYLLIQCRWHSKSWEIS